MSGKHRPGYWRDRHIATREAKGITPREEYDNYPHILKAGRELKMMMELPTLAWPTDLFRDSTKMAQPLQHQKLSNDALCICGKEHRRLYPRTQRSDFGHGFNVRYYCSNSCKGNAAKAETGRVNGDG